MSVEVTLNNETFQIPVQGTAPEWGEQASDYLVALNSAITSIQGPGDINITTSNILNNQSSATNVTGLAFSSSQVQGIEVEYIVIRSYTTPAIAKAERGIIKGIFDGSNWQITVERVGNAGVDFDITSGGQLQYFSDDYSGTSGYSGQIIFRARTLN